MLKPLHGMEADLFENLASFCDQSYPQFQVIFGVQRADDPAIAVVGDVIARFPQCDITLALDDRVPEGNAKVANLANMMRYAKHPLIVIADADMRVDARYLSAIAADFTDDRVGAVTCLYAGTAAGGVASQLGAMHINEQFIPSVLVATMLAPLTYCFGSTMAVRRDVLEEIGGMQALAKFLADDYMLGSLVHERGYRVALSPYVVRNIVHEPDVRTLWHHEVRWARTIRAQRPLGYAFSFVTMPLPLAILFAACCANVAIAVAAVVMALSLRLCLAAEMRRFLPSTGRAAPWLIPVRDCFALGVWAAGMLGREVRWRGRDLSVDKEGRI